MSVRESWTVLNTAGQWSFTEHFGNPSAGQGDTAIRFFAEVWVGRICICLLVSCTIFGA